MTENKETQSTIDEQLKETSKKFYEKHGYCFNVTKQGVRVEVNKTSFEGLNFFADFMLRKVRDNPKKAKTEDLVLILDTLYELFTLLHRDLGSFELTTRLCLDNVCDKLGFNEWCGILNKGDKNGNNENK